MLRPVLLSRRERGRREGSCDWFTVSLCTDWHLWPCCLPGVSPRPMLVVCIPGHTAPHTSLLPCPPPCHWSPPPFRHSQTRHNNCHHQGSDLVKPTTTVLTPREGVSRPPHHHHNNDPQTSVRHHYLISDDSQWQAGRPGPGGDLKIVYLWAV